MSLGTKPEEAAMPDARRYRTDAAALASEPREPVTQRHETCIAETEPGVDALLAIIVGREHATGHYAASVRFPTGQRVVARKGNPDLGFTETDTVLHDVAHTLLAARLGLGRSPVLERVVDLRPLSQRDVDLEELATFALQAWCAALRGEDPGPALDNAATALRRLRNS